MHYVYLSYAYSLRSQPMIIYVYLIRFANNLHHARSVFLPGLFFTVYQWYDCDRKNCRAKEKRAQYEWGKAHKRADDGQLHSHIIYICAHYYNIIRRIRITLSHRISVGCRCTVVAIASVHIHCGIAIIYILCSIVRVCVVRVSANTLSRICIATA